MSLQCLNREKPPIPYSIISLDAEWQQDYKDAYVWCVCGRLWNKKTNSFNIVDKVFHDKKDVFNYLFNKEWKHTILTGFNILVDLYTLYGKDLWCWNTVTNMGKFVFAQNPKHYIKLGDASYFFTVGTLDTNVKNNPRYQQ